MSYLFIHRCDCGNCSVVLAQNISECYCCKELEACDEALESDLVQQSISPNAIVNCVTEHLGFNPVCLQKWSLRMAASKFKIKGKQQYRQKGSEEKLVVTVPITRLTTYASKPKAKFEVIDQI